MQLNFLKAPWFDVQSKEEEVYVFFPPLSPLRVRLFYNECEILL